MLLPALLALGGCASPRDSIRVNSVTTARPQPILAQEEPTGAIFRPRGNLLLFEDYRPRAIGDVLTIQLSAQVPLANIDFEQEPPPSLQLMTTGACRGMCGV